jgi:hypothetical protein
MKRTPADTIQLGLCQAPYLCRMFIASPVDCGGAWARLVVVVVVVGCARALSLISVLGPGWLRVGDMMGGGVIPRGYAVRPLGL